MIEDGYYHASVDDYGRFHTNITNLKRELRSVLRVSGRPFWELDIKGSQMLFLGLEMKRRAKSPGIIWTGARMMYIALLPTRPRYAEKT